MNKKYRKKKIKEKDLPEHSAFEDTPIGYGYSLDEYELIQLGNGIAKLVRKKDGKVMR